MYFAWLFSLQPCPSLCDRHFLNTMPCCLVSSSPVFVSILCVVVSSTCSIGVENTSRKEIGGHFFPFRAAVLEDIIADTIVTKCSPTHNTSASRSPGPIPYWKFYRRRGVDDNRHRLQSFFSIFPLAIPRKLLNFFSQKDKYLVFNMYPKFKLEVYPKNLSCILNSIECIRQINITYIC